MHHEHKVITVHQDVHSKTHCTGHPITVTQNGGGRGRFWAFKEIHKLPKWLVGDIHVMWVVLTASKMGFSPQRGLGETWCTSAPWPRAWGSIQDLLTQPRDFYAVSSNKRSCPQCQLTRYCWFPSTGGDVTVDFSSPLFKNCYNHSSGGHGKSKIHTAQQFRCNGMKLEIQGVWRWLPRPWLR